MWLDLTLDPPLLQGGTRILHLQYFFKYVLTYFLHLNSYLVTFLHNTICRAQLFWSFSSVSFGISFEHAVQLPFNVLLYSTFPDNYAFLSLSPSQIKNTQSAETVPIHGHSPVVIMSTPLGGGHIIFAFSGVRRPTWFPDILGNSSYPIFTKFCMQVYWVNSLYGIAFGDDSSIAN